jgi:hypothetical protein
MAIDKALWVQHRERIEQLYYELDLPLWEVIEIMEREGFKASDKSYRRQLLKWNEEDPEAGKSKRFKWHLNTLLLSLIQLLWHRNYAPKRMLLRLQKNFGFTDLTKGALRWLRERYGVVQYRHISGEHMGVVFKARDYILQELRSGQTARFGRGNTHAWVRANLPFFVSTDDIRRILYALDYTGVQNRQLKERRWRKRWSVRGPNRVWSVDGHDKLSEYGFQVYGIIDAYSRYVLGCWVGHSNRTQVAVQKFYLKTVRQYGIPELVRSDKGTETMLMCAAQTALRYSTNPLLPFHKCYVYGPSTKNQRIEAWWNTLADGLTEGWKQFFIKLDKADLFDKECVYDIIALRYIYMDKLREQVSNFVNLHNIHTIRKQKWRDHVIPPGRPEDLYFFHDDAPDCKTVLEGTTEELLSRMEDDLATYNEQEYQSNSIGTLCKTLLIKGNVEYSLDEFTSALDQSHVRAYLFLRAALRTFEKETNFSLEDHNIEPPRGGIYWVMAQKEAERQRQEALRLNRRPEDIPEEELVSEEEMDENGEDESDEEGGILDGF